MSDNRISRCFARCRNEKRAALGIFVTAGDPDIKTATELLLALPDAGADFVELGMPFSDPMADGPVIQAASLRAIKAGTTLDHVLTMARQFRERHPETPLILMGYYNPVYVRGVARFLDEAAAAGVDGLIMVDLPPEEDDELCEPATAKGLDFIRLITPTTDDARLPRVVRNASGFLYYVSVTGITGTRSAATNAIAAAISRIRAASDLPLVVGFGIKTPQQVRDTALAGADGVVVGSAVVSVIADSLALSPAGGKMVKAALALVAELKQGTRLTTEKRS